MTIIVEYWLLSDSWSSKLSGVVGTRVDRKNRNISGGRSQIGMRTQWHAADFREKLNQISVPWRRSFQWLFKTMEVSGVFSETCVKLNGRLESERIRLGVCTIYEDRRRDRQITRTVRRRFVVRWSFDSRVRITKISTIKKIEQTWRNRIRDVRQ